MHSVNLSKKHEYKNVNIEKITKCSLIFGINNLEKDLVRLFSKQEVKQVFRFLNYQKYCYV